MCVEKRMGDLHGCGPEPTVTVTCRGDEYLHLEKMMQRATKIATNPNAGNVHHTQSS